MAHVGKPQKFSGITFIPIWADEPETPTLLIYYDEQAPQPCKRYAEKVARIINEDAGRNAVAANEAA